MFLRFHFFSFANQSFMPAISIVASFYNAAPFLRECLDSALAQTEESWEFVLVNNHSTDQGPELVRAYARQDSRIRLLPNIREGIVPALQTAFQAARGQFITRMDADDIMPPTKLEYLRRALQEKGRGHVSTGLVSYFSHEGEPGEGYVRYANWLNDLTRTGTNFTDIYRECVIPSPCWMVYRDDFEKVGAFQPEIYPEDYELCFRFYQHGLRIAPVSKLLHYWRDYPSRTSRNDPRYANPLYFDLKLPRFIELECTPSTEVVLWGGGAKGKTIAKWLLQHEVPFHWVIGNSAKHGHTIYGQTIQREEYISQLHNPRIIIAFSRRTEQREVQTFLESIGLQRSVHFFFFC